MAEFLIPVAISLLGLAPVQNHSIDQIAARAIVDPIPACEPGHENALVGGTITVNAGETICASLEVSGGEVVAKEVQSDYANGGALVLRLWREVGTDWTFLSVHNPLSIPVRIDISVVDPDGHARQFIDVCPKFPAVLHLPYVANRIDIQGIRAVSALDAGGCE